VFAHFTGRGVDVSPSGTSLLAAGSEHYQSWLERYDVSTAIRTVITPMSEDETWFAPTWAPSGTRIAFLHETLDETGAFVYRLCTAKPDGSDVRTLVSGADGGISWQPR
jgi:Tol biopolymer transport system component